jgi:hypothetical protein
MKRLKIAYDFHGVLEAYPEVLKSMLEALNEFHDVYVLSGPPIQQIYTELRKAGYERDVHFEKAISVVDWIKEQGHEMYQYENESWYCDDEIWWSSKAKICEDRSIHVLYDDKLEYKKYMDQSKTLFIHIK